MIFGGFVTAVAAAFYPIFFYPLAHKNEYSKCPTASRNIHLHKQTASILMSVMSYFFVSFCRLIIKLLDVATNKR